MGLAAVEAAALASSTFAALAAGASWANVIQTRKSLKASLLPDLHATGARIEPSGPIYGSAGGVTSLQFDIYNSWRRNRPKAWRMCCGTEASTSSASSRR